MMQGKRPKGAFCLTDGHLSFEECLFGDETPEVQGSSCAPRRHCERRFGLLRSIYKARIITVTAAKVMDIISRLPGCAGQAADVASACTQVKIENASKLLKNSNIGMSRHLDSSVYHNTNGRNHGPVWKTQSFLLSEICMVILWQDCYGKGNLRKFYWGSVGRRFPIGNASLYTVKKDYSCLCMWMTKNWLERNKTLIRCRK